MQNFIHKIKITNNNFNGNQYQSWFNGVQLWKRKSLCHRQGCWGGGDEHISWLSLMNGCVEMNRFMENIGRNCLLVGSGGGVSIYIYIYNPGAGFLQNIRGVDPCKTRSFSQGPLSPKSLHTQRRKFSKGHMSGMFGTHTCWASAISWLTKTCEKYAHWLVIF